MNINMASACQAVISPLVMSSISLNASETAPIHSLWGGPFQVQQGVQSSVYIVGWGLIAVTIGVLDYRRIKKVEAAKGWKKVTRYDALEFLLARNMMRIGYTRVKQMPNDEKKLKSLLKIERLIDVLDIELDKATERIKWVGVDESRCFCPGHKLDGKKTCWEGGKEKDEDSGVVDPLRLVQSWLNE